MKNTTLIFVAILALANAQNSYFQRITWSDTGCKGTKSINIYTILNSCVLNKNTGGSKRITNAGGNTYGIQEYTDLYCNDVNGAETFGTYGCNGKTQTIAGLEPTMDKNGRTDVQWATYRCSTFVEATLYYDLHCYDYQQSCSTTRNGYGLYSKTECGDKSIPTSTSSSSTKTSAATVPKTTVAPQKTTAAPVPDTSASFLPSQLTSTSMTSFSTSYTTTANRINTPTTTDAIINPGRNSAKSLSFGLLTVGFFLLIL